MRFGGLGDGFSSDQPFAEEGAPIGIEAWVRAEDATGTKWGVIAAYGDARQGICLAQRGNVWLYSERDVDAWEIGPVRPGQWTHLAAVRDQKGFHLFLDGRAVSASIGYFGKAAFPNGFSIGSPGPDARSFQGEIYEARLFSFQPGKFDPEKHLLLDYAGVRAGLAWTRQQRSRVIDTLATTPGVRLVDAFKLEPVKADWLVTPVNHKVELLAQIAKDRRSASLVLANGLVSRTFYLTENLACTGCKNLGTGAEFLRAVKPEARLKIDGRWFEIGGLKGQPEMSYLIAAWLPQMFAGADAFRFDGLTVNQPIERYPWQPRFHAPAVPWPPKGLHVAMRYVAPPSLPEPYRDLRVTVHYELYQGLPIMAKWLTVENPSATAVTVDKLESEILAVQQDQVERLHLESDYSFAEVNARPEEVMPYDKTKAATMKYMGGTTTQWSADPDYFSCAPQGAAGGLVRSLPAHYCLVTSRVPLGPAQRVEPGGHFQSMFTFELLQDSDDRERQSLAHRRLYRILAPQTSQQFLAVHARTGELPAIRHLLDQMAAVGLDRMQVGPHGVHPPVNSDNPEVRAEWKQLADYAHARGIRLGFYELMVASRGRGVAVDVVDPDTGQPGSPRWGQSVCVASEWADTYFPRLFRFLNDVGIDFIGVDGVYHGDVCASTTHKYHRGLEDSQWAQWQKMTAYLRECLHEGRETTTPDWYFLSGSQAIGMGYREPADKLPRELQLLLFRQYPLRRHLGQDAYHGLDRRAHPRAADQRSARGAGAVVREPRLV